MSSSRGSRETVGQFSTQQLQTHSFRRTHVQVLQDNQWPCYTQSHVETALQLILSLNVTGYTKQGVTSFEFQC